MYCPTDVKENYTPKKFIKYNNSLEDFKNILINLLSNVKFKAVSITGGEPILNKDIAEILETIYQFNTNIELNTNGVLINKKIRNKIEPFVRNIKLSMDSTNIDIFNTLTGTKDKRALEKIKKTIDIIKTSNKNITINTVVSKINEYDIENILDFIIKNKLDLSLLDLYGTDQTKKFWLENFIPVEKVWPMLKSKFNVIEREDLFGCTFYRYSNLGLPSTVRTKSSLAGTRRINKCKSCNDYCQEGIYAIKLSREGWMTTCPNNKISDGCLILPEDKNEKLIEKINPIIKDITNSQYNKNTFEKFLEKMKKNNL
ncbi:MAG: radical SAM protein [Candidatus Absconditabacterales bacterium]